MKEIVKPKKKKFIRPVLQEKGSLRQLTKLKGGSTNDGGGKPKTKTSGASA